MRPWSEADIPVATHEPWEVPDESWRCDWQPDEYQPAEDGCPYCAGRMCARFDGLNCTHNRVERHGYPAERTPA